MDQINLFLTKPRILSLTWGPPQEAIRQLMATWADYTIGTLIVIAHMIRAEHQGRLLREVAVTNVKKAPFHESAA
jgi:hypothetical protein